jgi:hypothetical protein
MAEENAGEPALKSEPKFVVTASLTVKRAGQADPGNDTKTEREEQK